MLETAVHTDMDNFGVRLQQEQPSPVKAEVDLFGEECDTKPCLEEPAEMTNAAATLARQFAGGNALELGSRDAPHQRFNSVRCAHRRASWYW